MRRAIPFLVLWSLAVGAVAQDAPPPPPPVAPPPAEAPAVPAPVPVAPPVAPAPAPGGDPAATAPVLHKVYVPYRDLQKVFEKEGQGVFVPYAEFRALWEKAYRMPDDPTRPPVAAALRAARYAGVADGDAIRFDARVEVEVLAAGWQRLPLDFGGVGIEEATLDGKPALLVPTERGYDLLLRGPLHATVDLVLRVAAPATGDTHVAELVVPPVPLSRLSLRVPGTDTDVSAEPRLAGSSGPTLEGDTELLAYLGPVSKVRLTWRRRPEETARVAPLVFAAETTDVLVDRGVVRTEFGAALSVLRAPLPAVALAVPSDAVVLYVDGPGIRSWERSKAGDRIDVTFREPVKEKVTVRVGLERAVGELPAEVVAPFVGVEKVERETGFVRLRAAEGVKVDPKAAAGLVQTDLADLPDPLRAGGKAPPVPGKAFAWRHAGRAAGLSVAAEALAPRVSAAVGNRVGIGTEATDVRAVVALTVERAGVFGVALDVPEALEVTDVRIAGAELDDWTRAVTAPGVATLRVALRDRLLGAATVTVAGRLPVTIADADGVETALDLPLVRVRDAQHVRGYVAVHADPALDRREASRAGLTPLEADAPSAVEPPALPDATQPVVARFEHREGTPALALAVKRKAATVTGTVETAVRLEPDRTRLEVRLVWAVQFRGVSSFRVRGPASLAARVHLAPRQAGMDLLEPVLDRKPDGAPADWAPEHATWTIALSAPRQGRVEAALVVDDQPEAPLLAGASRVVALPVFVPVGADGKPSPNSTLWAAVRRDPLLEVATERVERGEEIDARELVGATALSAPDTFLAFRSYDPGHAVALRVTKHEYEPVAEVVVSHMHLNTVVPVEGRATTEAFLVVRNNDRQYLELRLPTGANIRAVAVDGKAETPRRGDDGAVRVPLLANLRKDQGFVVALVYDHDVDRSGLMFQTLSLASPEPLRVTSDLLTWRVHVPREREWTAFGGDLERSPKTWSWAFRMLSGLSGLLHRRPASASVDLDRMVYDLERGSPFQVQSDGVAFLFGNRRGTGTVTLTSADPKAFLALRVLFLALGFALVRAATRVVRRRGRGAGLAFSVVLAVLLAVLVVAGPGLAALLSAACVGAAIAGAVALFASVAAGRRAQRERRRTQARSALPAAPPPPPAPPTPPATTPGAR